MHETESADYELIILGAGINGAGVARDAAMRGLKVLLLDKTDICGGTTAWSTRLIHGGLRYLEHAEVGLVRESLREREILLRIAPHLVRPLPIVIPIYAAQRRGPWTIRAGMLAYDLLSFDKSLPGHRLLSREEVSDRMPGLRTEGLRAAALYYDAQVEFPERLVLENVLSAMQHSAEVRTYTTVHNFLYERGQIRGLTFSDQTSKQHKIRCRLIVNAAGPWVDEVLERMGIDSDPPLVAGTKGSHIVVAPFTGGPADAIYVEAGQDKRAIFVIPWIGNYLIGTTDIRQDDSPDHVEIEDWEIEYLLAEVNRLVPTAHLTRESILFTYSGIRPLPYTQNKSGTNITRRHFIREHPKINGLMSLVGGKLTTYRSFAEQTVDLCYRKLGRNSPKCTTATTHLPGTTSSDFEHLRRSLNNEPRLSDRSVERLLRLYGSRATNVLRLTQENPELSQVLDDDTSAIAAEIVFAFKEEIATTLSDCLLRRTMLGLTSNRGLKAVEAAAQIAQRYVGWSDGRAGDEVESYRRNVQLV